MMGPDLQFEHRLVRLGSSARWTDQQVDVLLHDVSHGRRAFFIREDGVLRNF
jgi:hypothetical protein